MISAALLTLALAAPAAPSTFELKSGEVTFEIEAPLDTISGVSRGLSGSATIDPAAWTTAPQAKVDVDLASFRTGIDLRDEDLRDQFFETGKFTKATLVVTGLERASAQALVDGAAAEAVANATLSLHGVEKPVKIPLKAVLDESPSGRRVVVTGDFTVPLLDHAIKRPKRLIFKLGTDVKVHLRAVFRGPPSGNAPAVAAAKDPKAAAAAADKDEVQAAVPPPPVVARPVDKPKVPTFQFGADTAEGRGERAFYNAKIGGEKNALACRSCHSTIDERKGLLENGIIKPSSSIVGAAGRASLWQGIAQSPAQAADICSKLFMRKSDGLDAKVKGDLEAYMKKMAPDPQPALDYDAIHLSRRSYVNDADKGNAANGKKLVTIYCKSCHDKGRVRPELEPGLYEADMLVKRIRRIPGSDNQQMPLFTMNKLPDSELRDIVTYLVGTPDQRIFTRSKKVATAAPTP